MKAQSISTPGRAKKIIVIIWLTAISASSVIVPFVNGVSIRVTENLTLKLNIFLYHFNSTKMYHLIN